MYMQVSLLLLSGHIAALASDSGLFITVDGVPWSVYWFVSVCLSVGHVCEPCKTAEPIEMPFSVGGGADSGWPKESCVRNRSRSAKGNGQFGGCAAHSKALRVTVYFVLCNTPILHLWTDFNDLYIFIHDVFPSKELLFGGHVDTAAHIEVVFSQ